MSRKRLKDVPLLPHSDVTITVRGETVMSSRAYLAAYSPVLDTTFDNDFREGQQRAVAYDDIDPSDFAEFLLAIYPVQKDIEGLDFPFFMTRYREFSGVRSRSCSFGGSLSREVIHEEVLSIPRDRHRIIGH